jgi:hypothetical protein
MGETLDTIFGVIGRSLIRHAIVGAASGGVGNIFIVFGDILDVSDALDSLDAIAPTDSSSAWSDGEVHFGSNLHPSDGCLVDQQTGVCRPFSPCYMFRCLLTNRLAILAPPITTAQTQMLM